MNNTASRQGLSRRSFLKILAAGSATTIAAYALSEYTPWLNYEGQVAQTWKPLENGAAMSAQKKELVRYATLASNGHNTQPWKFAIQEHAIQIHPDYSRELKVVDPERRELWISLGCALENLLIAARASGFATQVTYPEAQAFIHVELTPDTPQSDPLYEAIPVRQNTRSEYDGQPIQTADLDRLQALPLEPGITLKFFTNPDQIEMALDYVHQGNLSQYADPAFLDELISWLRFNKKEALSALDGLYSRCSGNPEVPRWLGQMFVAGTKPQQQAEADARKLRSSPAAVVIASETEDQAAWVRAGQIYERLALKTTALHIKSAFLNQPIEVKEIRSQFQSAAGLGTARPQLLVRLGYAEALLKSLRRPLEEVMI